jgi:hypothetical protein
LSCGCFLCGFSSGELSGFDAVELVEESAAGGGAGVAVVGREVGGDGGDEA